MSQYVHEAIHEKIFGDATKKYKEEIKRLIQFVKPMPVIIQEQINILKTKVNPKNIYREEDDSPESLALINFFYGISFADANNSQYMDYMNSWVYYTNYGYGSLTDYLGDLESMLRDGENFRTFGEFIGTAMELVDSLNAYIQELEELVN